MSPALSLDRVTFTRSRPLTFLSPRPNACDWWRYRRVSLGPEFARSFEDGGAFMKAILSVGLSAGVLLGVAWAQPPGPPQPAVHADPQPIYRVTVVSRNLEAVNYQHRGGPTPIDFQGTVLLPHAKGAAIVDSHRGEVS